LHQRIPKIRKIPLLEPLKDNVGVASVKLA
jgi:hypothetical protein